MEDFLDSQISIGFFGIGLNIFVLFCIFFGYFRIWFHLFCILNFSFKVTIKGYNRIQRNTQKDG